MKLYYTNISAEEAPQTRPDLSLGGFKSSTIVPNNMFANLFADISLYTYVEAREEFIALAMVNDTGVDVTDVTLHFIYPESSQKKFEIAFVSFNANREMEFVQNIYSTPYNAEFNEADGVANAINIGNMLDGGKVGIWLKKIINKDVIATEYSNDNLEMNGTPEEVDEEITLNISWT